MNCDAVEATEKWKKFHWFLQILIGAAGLLVIMTSSYAIYRGVVVYQHDFPLVKASMEMQLEATTAYLWFEEMKGGDESRRLEDILGRLDLAVWYGQAMLQGGENRLIRILPLKEKALYEKINALNSQLAAQRTLLLDRAQSDQGAGPGSDIDRRYHATLEAFLADARIIEMEVEGLIVKNFHLFKTISVGVIVLCTLLFLTVGISFFRYESLRRRHYTEIVDMHGLLIQQEKMAALGTMMAGIAHEVNNPNSFITLNIPLLKTGLDDLFGVVDGQAAGHADFRISNQPYATFRNDLLKIVANIESGSDRINRIVSTLMNFSRNKKQIRLSWFRIGDSIDAVINLCGPKIERRINAFSVRIADDVPEKICFDPEILEISLLNLLNNAVEAADKADAWIKLSVFTAVAKDRPAVVVEVADNGSGIDADGIKKIFEPFFTTKSSSGGTGLGLYLCYTLLQQIDAGIEVESEPGSGAVFRLVLNTDRSAAARHTDYSGCEINTGADLTASPGISIGGKRREPATVFSHRHSRSP